MSGNHLVSSHGCLGGDSSVKLLVSLEITRSTKCFPTLLTVVWFLSRVDALVYRQITRSTKCFPTLLTVV
jgi:hypothetical protein